MAKKKESYRDTWTYTGYTLKDEQSNALDKLRKMKSSVIALQPGMGKCKHPDSRILTNRGYIRLRDFIDSPSYGITDISDKGIKASTRDGEKLVTHLYREKDCLLRTLHLENGRCVNGTLKHRVLCQMDNGEVSWKSFADMQCGDRLMFSDGGVALQSSSRYDGMTKEMFYLLGVWLGDGACIFDDKSDKVRYSVSTKHEICEFLCEHFKDLVGKCVLSKGCYLMYFREPLCKVLRGVFGNRKLLSHDKYVPEFVFQGDFEQRLWFVFGLCDTDASVSSTSFEWCTKSKALCDGFCELLSSMGVFYHISKKTIHTGKYAGREYFRVRILRESFKTFLSTELTHSRIQRSLLEIVKNKTDFKNSVDHVFLSDEWKRNNLPIIEPKALEHKWIRDGRNLRTFYGKIKNPERTLVSRSYMKACLDGSGLSYDFLDYHAERVIDITEEVSDVMDIEVEGVHEYFSEGIINHNTIVSLHYAMELVQKGVDGFKAPVRCIFAVPKAATHAFEKECVTKLNKPYLLLTVKNKDVTWEEVFKHEIIIVEHTYFKQIVPAMQKITETFPTYLFIDEAHCLQNDKSELSKSLWTVRQKCLGVFCLTGTPLVNSIEGLYNLYHFTFPRVFPSWFAFRDRYCITKEREIYMRKKGQAFNPYQQKRIIKEIIGYQNMEELNGIIDRLTVKGAKKYNVEYKFLKTVLDPELTEAYVSAAQGLLVTKDEKDWGARLHDLQRVVDGNPITDSDGNMVSLPDGFISNKFRLMTETVKTVMERNEACLIYVEYLETVSLISDYLNKHKEEMGINHVHLLSGEIPEKTRAEIEVIMQPRDVVIMTSSGTASRNLQKANNLIFFNLPFSIQATIQACGRICRVDSAYAQQHVYMLEVDGTIDSYKIMLFQDHLSLVDRLMGEECRSSVTCDYVEIDRSRMDYIKKSLLWQKGMGKTIKGSGKGVKKKTASKKDEIKDDIKGNVATLDDFMSGDWSLG